MTPRSALHSFIAHGKSPKGKFYHSTAELRRVGEALYNLEECKRLATGERKRLPAQRPSEPTTKQPPKPRKPEGEKS